MNKTLLATIVVLATAGTASAGGVAGSVGVGAEFQLSGIGGLSANYDAGKFHVGGFVGFFDPDGPANTFDIGGRFFYHVASTPTSDFGVGGGLGIQSLKPAVGDSSTNVFIEPSFQIRMFVVQNVALSFTGGIEIGNISGEAGIHYYF